MSVHESKLEQCRYYICLRELTAEQFAAAVQSHWGIENRLHWVLEVSFCEDASTVLENNAPQNLSLLKTIVFDLIRLDIADKNQACL